MSSTNDSIQQRNAAVMRRVLSRRQAAEALGVSTWTIDRRIEDRTLQAVRFGRTIRIPIEEIENLLAGSKEPGTNDPVDAWVERVLATAPPLTDEQRTRLAELLRPVRKTGGTA
jgi:excisionase family DNA binding protein